MAAREVLPSEPDSRIQRASAATTMFGWCIDQLHDRCTASFTSSLTFKAYACACACHRERITP